MVGIGLLKRLIDNIINLYNISENNYLGVDLLREQINMKRPIKEELVKYDVYYEKDTVFTANARLLQSKWRVKHKYPINTVIKSNYGNFIETEYSKREKVNFLTPNIRKLVTEKISLIRANGGLVGEPRIWNNLLSSQPLCFNLFGELSLDLELATKYFKKLFPSEVSVVIKIDFEYSSKRDNPDNSAFDVFIGYLNDNNQKCFIGIEVKFQESLFEETPGKAAENYSKHKDEYLKMTTDSNFFKPNSIEKLKLTPIAQIWRDHLLAWNMSQDYHDGFFVFLYPFENTECQNGVEKYRNHLIINDERITKFYPRDLTKFILTLSELINADWSKELEERYIVKT